MAKIKKGDKVIILAGREKGKEGTITRMLIDKQQVLIEGLNLRKKTVKASADQPSNRVEFSAPLHISNVALIDPKTKKATRVGFQIGKDGKKVRIARKSSTVIK